MYITIYMLHCYKAPKRKAKSSIYILLTLTDISSSSSDNILEASPESDVTSMDFRDTELTLGLPGKGRSPAVTGGKSYMKRGYIETVDFNFNISSSSDLISTKTQEDSGAGKPPAAKAQVVGWPPVKSSRKKLALESCKYVKVGADGAPFLRKVDLETYESYEGLLKALEEMFDCFTMSRNFLNESKLMDPAKGLMDYVPTYEDKDGDWMLVGDVPWKMFTESCKRIQLVKSSEAAALAPRTPPKCTN